VIFEHILFFNISANIQKNLVSQLFFLYLQRKIQKDFEIMLKDMLSISGKPGLFKLISKGKNIFIAESLVDHTRIPVYSRDKVVSLGDITMYADDGDVRLAQILQAIKQKENGEVISFSSSITTEELKTYFSQVLPNFDRDKVYPSDIKKVMNWYNLLVKEGLADFEEEEEPESDEGENDEERENNSESEIKEDDRHE